MSRAMASRKAKDIFYYCEPTNEKLDLNQMLKALRCSGVVVTEKELDEFVEQSQLGHKEFNYKSYQTIIAHFKDRVPDSKTIERDLLRFCSVEGGWISTEEITRALCSKELAGSNRLTDDEVTDLLADLADLKNNEELLNIAKVVETFCI